MRLRSRFLFGLAGVVVLPLTFSALASVERVSPAQSVSTTRLRSTVERLADPSLSGRRSGTPGAFVAARYIYDQFAEMGLETRFQDLDEDRRNVVARAGNAAEHILIGAHYDGQGGSNPGASDNAAGVAVMLELARRIDESELDVSLVFVAFDDEEQGLNGSRYYAANPVYPLSDARAAVILDTMGRSFVDLDEWSLIVLGTEMSPSLAGVVAREAGSGTIAIGTDLIGARSDFAPFAVREVPYLFFTNATHTDYHGPGDTPDKVHYDRLAMDAETIGRVVGDIAELPQRPFYADDPVYPSGEAQSLRDIMALVEDERPDLASAYTTLFDDARERLANDPSRINLRLATEVLLAAATPRFAFFSLGYLLGPLYEADGSRDAALAAYREAARLSPDAATRNSMQAKIAALDP